MCSLKRVYKTQRRGGGPACAPTGRPPQLGRTTDETSRRSSHRRRGLYVTGSWPLQKASWSNRITCPSPNTFR
ncbi:hypothetical protein HBI56_115530 [Parastagonospora nodorum]|uniref:Uncharacterized protein n=1 Tax=Phaeosphaeria nodorum (strain SN15 / ATCC MYA-4574 / FGSC 10173) TaxID=321614 RepID=A0A7U2FAC9_PHANO|nr:hypothetical protein HBH56_196390 [Parastagonospora nodorum]QRD00609.1 hypothetical protein JI435_415430 [Parastagonospora nodorum SN15]KAH3924939.1 hypothetical protein HBH54_187100 [Parastagonospora nodorum]KAH3953393.1 hypothetical protein HBH53_039240 [Parastagonospora nodorum]KAH3976548.1 hypothetical protein HBH52_119240 [Parastagonospora nodorum]